jgi:sugar/nucleoside kinase (ribokinase family)
VARVLTENDPAGAPAGPDVVLAGHILNEKVVFPDRVLYPVLGSPVAYCSVCLACLGARVGIVTKIGEDFPRQLMSVFREVGVDTAGVHVGAVSTHDELIYQADGRKILRYVSRAPAIGYEDFPQQFLRAKIIYLCPMDHEVSLEGIRQLSLLGRTMMVDLGGFGGATSADHPLLKDGRELRSLFRYFHIVKGSIEDLGHIFGAAGADEEAVAARILESGSGVVVVTLGARGAYVRSADNGIRYPAYHGQQTAVVDPTGAGDCFSAGFLFHYGRTQDAFSATLYGNAVTSFVIERTGGVLAERMPSRGEADRRADVIRSRLASNR